MELFRDSQTRHLLPLCGFKDPLAHEPTAFKFLLEKACEIKKNNHPLRIQNEALP